MGAWTPEAKEAFWLNCNKPIHREVGMERETGIEPATNRLEICDSTIELLPQVPFHSTLK